MGKPVKNKANAIKATDGRISNGRKPGTVVKKQKMYTPAAMNKAKKDRIKVHALNAVIQEFGSEEKFFGWLAEKARKSNYHLGKLMDYGYGNPEDYHSEGRTLERVNINFFGNTNINGEQVKKEIEVFDVDHEDYVDETEDETTIED